MMSVLGLVLVIWLAGVVFLVVVIPPSLKKQPFAAKMASVSRATLVQLTVIFVVGWPVIIPSVFVIDWWRGRKR